MAIDIRKCYVFPVKNGDSVASVNNGKLPPHYPKNCSAFLPLFTTYSSIILLYLMLY